MLIPTAYNFYAKPQYANVYLNNDKYATDFGHDIDIDSTYYICIQMYHYNVKSPDSINDYTTIMSNI